MRVRSTSSRSRCLEGLLACVSDATDQGIDILLDHNLRCDSDYEDQPYVDVSANYNAAGEADTSTGLAKHLCEDKGGLEDSMAEGVGRPGGRAAAGCRQYFNNNLIRIQLIALRETDSFGARGLDYDWRRPDHDNIALSARYARVPGCRAGGAHRPRRASQVRKARQCPWLYRRDRAASFGVTHGGGPNVGYDFIANAVAYWEKKDRPACLRRHQLTGLRAATVGGALQSG